MDVLSSLKKFLCVSNEPTLAHTQHALTLPHTTNSALISQPQHKYLPAHFDDFIESNTIVCEYPDLSIDEIAATIHANNRHSIKRSDLLDHRAICKVSFSFFFFSFSLKTNSK